MEDEDKQDCCDTEPVKDPSVAAVVGIMALVLVGGLGFISTVMPFFMAWSRWLTTYFNL